MTEGDFSLTTTVDPVRKANLNAILDKLIRQAAARLARVTADE